MTNEEMKSQGRAPQLMKQMSNKTCEQTSRQERNTRKIWQETVLKAEEKCEKYGTKYRCTTIHAGCIVHRFHVILINFPNLFIFTGSTMSSRVGDRVTNNHRYLIIFLLLVQFFKNIGSLIRIVKLFQSGQAASAPSGHVGLAVLAADEVINSAWHGRQIFLLLFKHDSLSVSWIADACLLVGGVVMPVFNLIAAMTLPGFMQQKNYVVFHAFACAIIGFLLPPAHMIAHWVLSSPVYMWVHV